MMPFYGGFDYEHQNEAYSRLMADMHGPGAEVSLVIRDKAGGPPKTVAVFHDAVVIAEQAHQAGDYYSAANFQTVTTEKSVYQLRVTTAGKFTLFSESYFADKMKGQSHG